MTGPEHYREAERLLSISVERSAVERAQAHALLALAAATAAPLVRSYLDLDDRSVEREWTAVVS